MGMGSGDELSLGQRMNENNERGAELLLRNLQRIHANLQFADRKAGILMGANSAVLALLYQILQKDSLIGCAGMLPYAGSVFLILGVVSGFVVVWPRGEQNRNRGEGIVCQDRIALFKDSEAYLNAVKSASNEQVFTELQTLTFDASCIDRLKYQWLRVAMIVSGIGGLLAVIAFVVRLSQSP